LLEVSQKQTQSAEAALQQVVDDHEQSLKPLGAEIEALKAQSGDVVQQTTQPSDYENLVERLRTVMRELEENDDRFIA
jgi:hypothetical protein